ncbi:hypothetical protein B0I37DRAFT_445627 [Chaetomium sp. MPI-CAGE-AT-0009]|nr:hypothetical protein B0I37DRAFT_445627 [Chaetomium sp. MPI-CAGE-AT-0009]
MSSSLDLDQVLYARAGWRKAILIPLWIFQVTVLLGLMGIFAYRLAETFEHYEELNKLGNMPIVEVVWEATNVGFNLIALLLTILEIARKATERLTPFMMVCSHVIKLTLAFGVLGLDIVAYLQRIDGHYSTIGLSLDCGLLAATLITFTYSIITYRRLLKYDDYDLTANAQTRGFVPGNDNLELGYNRYNPHSTTRGGQITGITTTRTTELRYSDSAYPSQTQAAFASTTTAATAHHPAPTPSPSGSVLKREVDRAIGAEFGWSTPPLPPQQDAAAVNRSGSVVLGGGGWRCVMARRWWRRGRGRRGVGWRGSIVG